YDRRLLPLDRDRRVRPREADEQQGDAREEQCDGQMPAPWRWTLGHVRKERGRGPGGRPLIAPAIEPQIARDRGRDGQQADQQDRREEAHLVRRPRRRNPASGLNQSPSVESAT